MADVSREIPELTLNMLDKVITEIVTGPRLSNPIFKVLTAEKTKVMCNQICAPYTKWNGHETLPLLKCEHGFSFMIKSNQIPDQLEIAALKGNHKRYMEIQAEHNETHQ